MDILNNCAWNEITCQKTISFVRNFKNIFATDRFWFSKYTNINFMCFLDRYVKFKLAGSTRVGVLESISLLKSVY